MRADSWQGGNHAARNWLKNEINQVCIGSEWNSNIFMFCLCVADFLYEFVFDFAYYR